MGPPVGWTLSDPDSDPNPVPDPNPDPTATVFPSSRTPSALTAMVVDWIGNMNSVIPLCLFSMLCTHVSLFDRLHDLILASEPSTGIRSLLSRSFFQIAMASSNVLISHVSAGEIKACLPAFLASHILCMPTCVSLCKATWNFIATSGESSSESSKKSLHPVVVIPYIWLSTPFCWSMSTLSLRSTGSFCEASKLSLSSVLHPLSLPTSSRHQRSRKTFSCSLLICFDRVSLITFLILQIHTFLSVTRSLCPVHSQSMWRFVSSASPQSLQIVMSNPFIEVPLFLRVRTVSVAKILASILIPLTRAVTSLHESAGCQIFFKSGRSTCRWRPCPIMWDAWDVSRYLEWWRKLICDLSISLSLPVIRSFWPPFSCVYTNHTRLLVPDVSWRFPGPTYSCSATVASLSAM